VIRQRPSGTPDGAAKEGADTASKAAANIALCFISETPFTHYTEKSRHGGIIPCPKGKMRQKPKTDRNNGDTLPPRLNKPTAF